MFHKIHTVESFLVIDINSSYEIRELRNSSFEFKLMIKYLGLRCFVFVIYKTVSENK